jgi:hypothetical protein
MGLPPSFWLAILGGILEVALWSGLLFPPRPYESLSGLIHTRDSGNVERQLDSNVYWITYYGRDSKDADASTLYRAASITKKHGDKHFIVLDAAEVSSGLFAMQVCASSKTIRILPDSQNLESYNADDVILALRKLAGFPAQDTLQ